MFYIKASSGITHQPTFKNSGFTGSMLCLPNNSIPLRPDYKNYINASVLRRMSEVLRMSVACAIECLEQSGADEAGAIIVGTGLGCLFDTEKFLNNAITIEGGMLPPTSFIQSTHNTIAGQISLIMQNHAYNMTHTQNTLSFEQALLDALLCLAEGSDNILVGAADEYIEQLTPIALQLGFSNLNLTSGCSFFVLANATNTETPVVVKDVFTYGLIQDTNDCIASFLLKNKLNFADIDLVLFGSIDEKFPTDLQNAFESTSIIHYLQYCGVYATASAFALHLAVDIIENKIQQIDGMVLQKPVQRILICNNLNPVNLGLILVQNSEA